jgi:hypothetical protein
MENVKTAQGQTRMQKLVEFIKKPFQYIIIFGALMIGFAVGRLEHQYSESKHQSPVDNPYDPINTYKNVTIAVDEHNKLILFNTSIGTYQVYSDSIGMGIFKMYSHRLFQQSHEQN